MARLKVDGYENLVRDTSSNAVINSSTSEYRIYMARHRAREQQSDECSSATKSTTQGFYDKSGMWYPAGIMRMHTVPTSNCNE